MSKVMWKFVDQKIVDASVDLIARTVYKTGEKGARLHNGNLSTMLRLMSLGFIMLLVIALSLKMFTY